MSGRLRPDQVPVLLLIHEGPDIITQNFDFLGEALGVVENIAFADRYKDFISEVAPTFTSPDARTNVVAIGPSSVEVARLAFVPGAGPGEWPHSIGTPGQRVVGLEDGVLSRGMFESEVDAWLGELLPPLVEQPPDQVLRVAIEVLLSELRLRIIENEQLLAQLVERAAIVEQLEGQIRFLEAELRRVQLDPDRAKPSVSIVRRLITGALVASTVAGGLGSAAVAFENARPLTEVHQETTTVIVSACDAVSAVEAAPKTVFGDATFGGGADFHAEGTVTP